MTPFSITKIVQINNSNAALSDSLRSPDHYWSGRLDFSFIIFVCELSVYYYYVDSIFILSPLKVYFHFQISLQLLQSLDEL